ncbi:hypothetical protein [Ligilactobacillus acidipiscis]|uniref:hypothetical protein n=1 Tax=Ligilactobacillus acidipiscis TaxID=89059 RepID=UPI0023F98AFA|nr:hypothetical protein [Ligilactobacillus acidipiscis]WEV56418.1 hypothetical protein OZX66_09320 [Ligilactobacillus acidipiscis]
MDKRKIWLGSLIALFVIAAAGRFGYRIWYNSPQHQDELRLEEQQKESKWAAKHKMAPPFKDDKTTSWRKDPKYIKQIQIAKKQGNQYIGGTKLGEVIEKMGKPTMVNGSLDTKSDDLKVAVWSDRYHEKEFNTVRLYFTAIDNLNDAQIVKVENNLQER